MKDLQLLAQRAMDELDVIGVPYGYVEKFEVNTRAKSRWGRCRRKNGIFSIDINVELLQDNVADESALDTLIHELLHTCPNCLNHGKEWQQWAELVNDCYACYNISRCSSAEEKGVDIEYHRQRRQTPFKWTIECEDCGRQWNYKRKPTRFDYDENGYLWDAKCPCGCKYGLRLRKYYSL